jgi:putative transposase
MIQAQGGGYPAIQYNRRGKGDRYIFLREKQGFDSQKLMPRLARRKLERGCFHVLNRGNHRQALFERDDEYAQFMELMSEALRRFEVELWAYCLMGNHWHLVVEVDKIEELSGWVHWICNRHVRLFHRERQELGGGHIYQGRYKSFPIQDEVYLYQVMRYVEANPVRARLVAHARDWQWSSLSRAEIKRELIAVERPRLQPWNRNAAWEEEVDRPMEKEPLQIIQQSIIRGTPYGAADWIDRIVKAQGLETTLRPRGRPQKSLSST